jgi:hypothetical protein
MLERMVTRRAAEIRTLLDRGEFAEARVPLRNGGTLPAAMYARIVLDDLDWLLATRETDDDGQDGVTWQRLAEDVELLHEVALARRYAMTTQEGVPA